MGGDAGETAEALHEELFDIVHRHEPLVAWIALGMVVGRLIGPVERGNPRLAGKIKAMFDDVVAQTAEALRPVS